MLANSLRHSSGSSRTTTLKTRRGQSQHSARSKVLHGRIFPLIREKQARQLPTDSQVSRCSSKILRRERPTWRRRREPQFEVSPYYPRFSMHEQRLWADLLPPNPRHSSKPGSQRERPPRLATKYPRRATGLHQHTLTGPPKLPRMSTPKRRTWVTRILRPWCGRQVGLNHFKESLTTSESHRIVRLILSRS